jgi:hypothetical protein
MTQIAVAEDDRDAVGAGQVARRLAQHRHHRAQVATDRQPLDDFNEIRSRHHTERAAPLRRLQALHQTSAAGAAIGIEKSA